MIKDFLSLFPCYYKSKFSVSFFYLVWLLVWLLLLLFWLMAGRWEMREVQSEYPKNRADNCHTAPILHCTTIMVTLTLVRYLVVVSYFT